jgi:hypothetical protein
LLRTKVSGIVAGNCLTTKLCAARKKDETASRKPGVPPRTICKIAAKQMRLGKVEAADQHTRPKREEFKQYATKQIAVRYAIEVRPARKLSTPCRLGALCVQRFTALALRVLSAPRDAPAKTHQQGRSRLADAPPAIRRCH